jgi:hypothetical protein
MQQLQVGKVGSRLIQYFMQTMGVVRHMIVGSRNRDRAKQGPGRVKKITDPMIFNQSTGKSVSYAHAARVGMDKHAKNRSLLHLASKE